MWFAAMSSPEEYPWTLTLVSKLLHSDPGALSLFAANPFGLHDFEKKEKGAGDLTIPAGKTATFRYRFYLHPGTTEEAKVAERYEEYAKSK